MKLDGSLQNALSTWRADLAHAKSGNHAGFGIEQIESRRVAVVVTHTGDIASLKAAGLATGFEEGGVVSGYVLLREVDRLAAVPSVALIALQPAVRIMLDSSLPEMRVPWKVPPRTPWPQRDHQWSAGGVGVIVAVIDTGIDIFHESFRKPDGTTRILELWDQSAPGGGQPPPAKFMHGGRVFDSQAINQAIAAGPPFVSIDEVGHGTHVAGIAAGNGRHDDRCSFPGRYVGVAPEADLIIVKAIALPATVLPGDVDEAIRWCADATTRLPGNKPVVINCSFGADTGPHDGHGSLDGFVDQVLRPAAGPPPGLAVVVSAGNAGDLEIHESGVVAGNGSSTTSFYMADGSLKANDLDIWFTGAAALNIEIIAPPNPALPGANTTGTVTPTMPGSPFTIGRMSIAIGFGGPFAVHGNRKHIFVTISAVSGAPKDTEVRPGLWQLKLTETAGTAAVWDAWFASKHGDGFPVFKLPGDPEHTPRRRENTISEPGTSRNAITIASYDDDGGHLADSSSRGPDTTPAGLPVGEFKPTVAAPGVGVKSSRSRNDPDEPCPCCDQKVVEKEGTSMAAPHVTGLVALIFEKNRTLNFEQARAHIQHAARIDGIPAGEVPPVYDVGLNIRANPLWGSGKVDAAQTLADIPAAALAGGGGGGGAGGLPFAASDWGYTPHNHVSRLGEWRTRFGPRPGLMLFASLVSEHVDEVLRLVNHNVRVGAVWRRHGGPLLVRRLLNGPPPQQTLLPATLEGCDVAALLCRFLAILKRFGGPRLRRDIERFGSFAAAWPRAGLELLDDEATRFETAS